jgi:hypothetical protein
MFQTLLAVLVGKEEEGLRNKVKESEIRLALRRLAASSFRALSSA